MNRLRRLAQWLRPRMPYINIGLTGAAYWANEYWVQGFCQPVEWAAWVLVFSTAAFLVWPWLGQAPLWARTAAWFLQGLFLTVCVYCALFIALVPSLYLESLLLFFLGFPLLLWLPVFFIWQLKRRAAKRPLAWARAVFLAGAFCLMPFYLWTQYRLFELGRALAVAHIGRITSVDDLAKALPRTYVSKWVLGLGWRYHTSPEFIFDGWRPPLHEPMLLVSLLGPVSWFGDMPRYSWPDLSLEESAQVYKRVFPDEPTKPGCVCAHIRDAEEYLDWEPQLNDPHGDTTRTGRGGLFGSDAASLNQ